ncbi:hypothetical protein [Spirosoma sordidisoli]|uniref:hypothetical protein n=1 Tax=Spirosoma sordidisoli TaxID=2502893 RepID=UPI0013EB028F|nr:hypothetical protein [Spirosoma sordidisoli]
MSYLFEFDSFILLLAIAALLGIVGIWMVLLAWRDNQRVDRAINSMKSQRHV